MCYTTSTFIIFRANARVKTRQRLNDRGLDDVAYDIDSEMIVPLFMDEVDISGVGWVVGYGNTGCGVFKRGVQN